MDFNHIARQLGIASLVQQWNLLLFKFFFFFPEYNLNRIGHNYICFGNWKKHMIGNVCFPLSLILRLSKEVSKALKTFILLLLITSF